jgi:hypothetical protein
MIERMRVVILGVMLAACGIGLCGCGKPGGSGGGAGASEARDIPVGLVGFEIVSAELVEHGGRARIYGDYGGSPYGGPSVPDPLADLRAQGVLQGYDQSVRTGVGPNGGIMRPEVTVRITNHGPVTLTRAFVRFGGAVREAVEQAIPEDKPLAEHEVCTYTAPYLDLNLVAMSEDPVQAEVVAVVLADGTVYGDTELVARARRGQEQARAAQERAEAERQVPETPVATEWDGVVFDPASASVVSAVYGAGESWLDLTDHFVQNNLGEGHACGVDHSHFGIHDPAVGVYKTLALTVDIDGREVVATFRERDPVALGLPIPGDAAVGASGEPVEMGDARILAAWYGVGSHWLDVLDRVRELVDGGGLAVASLSELAGSDPSYGEEKQLRVYYEQGGRRMVAVVQAEDRKLVLPFASVEEVALDEMPPAGDFPPIPEIDEAWLAGGEAEPTPAVKAEEPNSPTADAPGELPAMGDVTIEDVAEKLFGARDIEIVQATFGVAKRQADVTGFLQGKIWTTDGLCDLQIVSSGLLVDDPAPGKIKQLRVTANIAGEQRQFSARSRGNLAIGAPGQIEGLVGTTAKPIDLGGMQILAAWYGAESGWYDGMAKLRAAALNGRIDAVAGRSLMGQDPASGTPKQLRVYFKWGDEIKLAVYEEDEHFVLPFGE